MVAAMSNADHSYESGYERTSEQTRELIDARARHYFGISGEEFVRRWNAGEYDDEGACPQAIRIGMLIPVGGE